MNQRQAFLALKRKAAEAGCSIRAYCQDRSVSPGVATHWKKHQRRNVNIETLEKLEITELDAKETA